MEKIRDPHSPLGLDAYYIFRKKSLPQAGLWATDAARQPTIFSKGAPFQLGRPLLLCADEEMRHPILSLAAPKAQGERWSFAVELPLDGRLLGSVVCQGGKRVGRGITLLSPGGETLAQVDRGGLLGDKRLFLGPDAGQEASLGGAGLFKRSWLLRISPQASWVKRPLIIAAAFLYVTLRGMTHPQLHLAQAAQAASL